MRLLKLSATDHDLYGPGARKERGPVSLYADAANGKVYALSDELRDLLDPLWRPTKPQED